MPVCMGYFSVSFGFGAVAVTEGIRVWEAALISATTLAGAGQFAGVTLIAAAATLLETVLTLLVVNSRYSLMSLALVLVIVVLCFFSLFSSQVSAQENRNISINKQNVPFEEIVREVEAQTDYSFMYSTETVQSIGKVKIGRAHV